MRIIVPRHKQATFSLLKMSLKSHAGFENLNFDDIPFEQGKGPIDIHFGHRDNV